MHFQKAVEISKLKFNLFSAAIIAASIFSTASTSFAQDMDPRAPLKFPYSLHNYAVEIAEDKSIDSDIRNCFKEIVAHLKSGKNFYSEVMAKKYTYTLDQSPLEEVRDTDFFHYTNADTVKIANDSNVTHSSSIFQFIRSRKRNTAPGWFFYVAADPNSSRYFGTQGLKIKIKKSAKIYNEIAGLAEVEGDLMEKYPNLKVCKFQAPALSAFAVEANGIDLIAYLGINDRWYEVASPTAIESMEALK